MSKDDLNLFRAIRDLGDAATPEAIAEAMEMSLPSALTLIKRNESRLRWDGEFYSLHPDAEAALHNDASTGSRPTAKGSTTQVTRRR